VFDLGHPAGRDAHHLGELSLGEAVALAFLSEAVTASPSRRYDHRPPWR
jgi:hypothetical protein